MCYCWISWTIKLFDAFRAGQVTSEGRFFHLNNFSLSILINLSFSSLLGHSAAICTGLDPNS